MAGRVLMSAIRAVGGGDAAPSSGAGRGLACSKYQVKPIVERIPWRSAGTGIAGLGAPAGISVFNPLFGELVFSIELIVVLTIIATALFGSRELSERSFRLLRWFGNRPEPPGPP
jgi:hypothetical protein